MRLFAGVELAPDVQAACAAASSALASRLADAGIRTTIRWTPEPNLHVTLWFFGDVDEVVRDRIAAEMDSAWTLRAFAAAIGNGGAFPPSGAPRVLWLGLLRGAESFEALYGALAQRVAPLGFPAERRPYHPHITIGRVKDARDAGRIREVLRDLTITPMSFEVRAITLFRSRLSPRGSAYEPLLRVPLS